MVGVALMVLATTGLAITPVVGAAGVENGKGIVRFNKRKNISLLVGAFMAFGACSLRVMTGLRRRRRRIDCVHTKGAVSQNDECMIYLDIFLIDLLNSHSGDDCDPFLRSIY